MSWNALYTMARSAKLISACALSMLMSIADLYIYPETIKIAHA